ncbi:ABC transporter ATP-binding protein [Eubacterium sp. am_0171]|uniref:ATP-binding cassette domain-containing protein n=1 Tax=unclassified Eubacterium (in: firmicutes) TaxID=2624479 RepID=UPI00101F4C46|nr:MULTISPECIES: ABC transporter ATP-binding protein [unclassified Eubacterium (in: firmicutes)]MSC86652.1 ATP-binding cassette domain-containing protein [Eubacterium sp. BIOML-A1]MSD08855.1 ATP-binding cassette domain-containing protein [Eubacterium sp. BIOML-A2]RYT10864.1 ABC transporter ATP-binding protein [Eubacterium sp. am_0171]
MLFKYFLKRILFLIPYLLLIFLNPTLGAKSNIISAEMMDNAVAGDYAGFSRALLIVLLIFVAHGLLLFLVQALRANLVKYARESLRKDMFRRTMFSFTDIFNDPDVGHRIAAFSNDITILENKYFEAWLSVLENIIALIISAYVVFTLNRKLAVVIIIGEIVSVSICFIVKAYSVNKNRIYIDKLSLFTQRIKDYFSAFQTIHNYLVEDKIRGKFAKLNRDMESSKDDADMALTFVNTLAKTCNSVLKFIVTGYGIVLMMNGEITIGLIYAAYQFCNQIISPMQSIIMGINSIESVKSISEKIRHLFNYAKTNTAKDEEVLIGKSTGIEIEDVTVTVNDKNLINHVSHCFLPGKKYLIIGKNGAGKSTLLRLLKNSTMEYTGRISLDGIDLKKFPHKQLSKKVCYINESVSLICDTVKHNITLFRDIEDERLTEIVNTVGLTVPLERVVKDGERNLSSGETRRVEIARSLVNQPEAIIYDEAISTLDVQTAYSIENMLLNLEQPTVIFVSHNFSPLLIRKYDEIVLMDRGDIVDYGTHDELIARNNYYRHICEIKSGKA